MQKLLGFLWHILQSHALHCAAFGGHLPCVKYLAAKLGERKFDLNMQAESCLHKAVEGGSLRVVRYLIDKCGLDPKLQNGVRHSMNMIMHHFIMSYFPFLGGYYVCLL